MSNEHRNLISLSFPPNTQSHCALQGVLVRCGVVVLGLRDEDAQCLRSVSLVSFTAPASWGVWGEG